MIPKEKSFPVFESNQVLTNAHLNQLLEYLDEQNRLSRANLVGVGVVCGMEVSWDGGTARLSISHGCGVTSEGYLAHVGVPGDEPEDCTPVSIADFSTDRFKKYEVPRKPGYAKFHPECDRTEPQFELWELVPDTSADYDAATELDEGFLADKVVLLHVELDNEQLKNCSPNSCDDKGSETGYAFRPLLIAKENAEKLNITLEGHDTLPDLGERLGLPDLRMPRLNVPNDDMVTANRIFEAYFRVLLEGKNGSMFGRMGQALTEAQAAFSPVVKAVAPNYNFSNKMASQEGAFRNLFKISKSTPIYYAQYYYDFLCDLIQAYDEFRWKGLELMSLCCPHEALFPRHLFLGEVFTNATGELEIFRHRFRPSMAIAHAQTTAEEVRQLFERLVLMIEKFNPAGIDDIRITPSRYGEMPLSQKAIPYYYRDGAGQVPLHRRWDFSKNKIGRARQNLGYHADQYASDDFVKKPLEYDLEPYNFFRIEGHLGDSWTTALRSIMKQIKEYRLPFDVVVLNAGNQAVEDKKNPWKDRCLDNDLDVIYRIWANEVKCLYRQKIGVLTKTKKGGTLTLSDRMRGKKASSRDPLGPTATLGANFLGASTAGSATTLSMANFVGTGLTAATFQPSAFVATNFFNPSTVAPSSSTIFNEVDISDSGIGTAVVMNIDKKEVNSPAKLKTEVNRQLLQNAEYKDLPVTEYQVVAGHKVNVVADLLNVAEELEKEPSKLDYARLYDKFDTLDVTLGDYLVDLEKYNPNDKDATLSKNEVQEMIRQLQSLQSTCLRNRLEELRKEMEAKEKTVEELIYFSRYVSKHPDLRHKAGVPVGGTFVMVFQEKFRFGLTKINRLDIPEGVVIADFFLPYRCCSDCPSVQFVLPPSRPVFNVKMGCPDENDFVFATIDITHGIPPFEVKVGGGGYQLLNGGVELNPGEHTLVVRDAEGGESLPKKVTARERMAVDAASFECDANNEFYVARLRIENGTPPFSINGKEVAHEEEASVFFINTEQLESGQLMTLEIGDGSSCPVISLDLEHTCEVGTIEVVADNATTTPGTPVTLNVLANDTGQDLKVTNFKLTNETMGQVFISPEGDLEYTPSAAATGQTVTLQYEVTDAQGQTAESSVTITVGGKECDLPGNGIARRCHFRSWIQLPGGDEGYRKYKGKVEKLVVNNGLDLTDVVPAFEPTEAELLPAQFHTTMKAWVEKLNEAVQSNVPAEQKGWWTIGYETTPANYGLLRIEHFTELDFAMRVSGGFRIGDMNTNFEAIYVPNEGTVGMEDSLNVKSNFEIRPFDCTDLDKCLSIEKAQCEPTQRPKLGIKVHKLERQGGRITVQLEGLDESDTISTWFWDTGNGISALPNERITTATFKRSGGNNADNLQTIRLFGFTKNRCMGMVTKVVDLDLAG